MAYPKRKVYIGLSMLCALMLLYLIPFGILRLMGPDTMTLKLKEQIEAQTARTLNFGPGTSIALSWNFSPTINFKNVALSNPEWAKDKNFLEMENLYVSVNLLAFLKRKISIQKLVIRNGTINLATQSAAVNNWTLFKKKKNEEKMHLSIGDIKLKNIKINYNDRRIKRTQTFYINRANLKTDHLGTPNYVYALLKYNKQKFELNSSVVRENGHLRLTDLLIRNNNNVLRGNMLVDFQDYRFEGTFQAPQWQFRGNGTQQGKYIVPDFELPSFNLTPWSGKFNISLKELQYKKIKFDKTVIESTLENNALSNNITVAHFAGGRLSGQLIYKMRARAHVNLNLKGESINTEAMVETFIKDALVEKGLTNFHIQLQGSGQTVHQAAKNAKGDVLFHSKQLIISNFDRLEDNILSGILTGVYPDIRKVSSANVECMVTHFNVKKGTARADKGIGLESSSLFLQGSGKIDLASETIDFTFHPMFPKKIKLPIGSATNYVKVTGTLSEPKISANPIGIIKEGGTIVAAIATGGVSLLAQSVINTARTDPSPCQTAIDAR